MMNPIDILPTDPKMIAIAFVVLALMASALVLAIVVITRSLVSGEPPVR